MTNSSLRELNSTGLKTISNDFDLCFSSIWFSISYFDFHGIEIFGDYHHWVVSRSILKRRNEISWMRSIASIYQPLSYSTRIDRKSYHYKSEHIQDDIFHWINSNHVWCSLIVMSNLRRFCKLQMRKISSRFLLYDRIHQSD